VKRLIVHLSSFIVLLTATAASISAQPVRIASKPDSLVHGDYPVTILTTAPVERVELLVNNVKWSEGRGPSMVIPVKVGEYIRRLRVRAVGYDAQGAVAGEDEMVINDPRPPFRIRLQQSGGMLSVTLIKPAALVLDHIDFFVGEEKVGTVTGPPYMVPFDAAKWPDARYARVSAVARDGQTADDTHFFGNVVAETLDVNYQQIPLSVAGSGDLAPSVGDLTLLDNGVAHPIESLSHAADQPLTAILLIDYSESMIEEMPVVKAAAKQFAQRLLRPNDRIAVVGFNQTLFWLTGFTNDYNAVAAAVDRVKPAGETHLYDSAIEMLFDIQKQPGRHALILFTDGVDQGSKFKLDHLVHYARYAGVPLYPVIKNKMLSRLMRFGVGQLEARRLAALARDTGATYFIIKAESELPAVYNKVAQELRQQYTLSFRSDTSTPDEWHSLAIQSKRGMQLRIPRGYFP
jgi:Ca-activated chloride channel family protein